MIHINYSLKIFLANQLKNFNIAKIILIKRIRNMEKVQRYIKNIFNYFQKPFSYINNEKKPTQTK